MVYTIKFNQNMPSNDIQTTASDDIGTKRHPNNKTTHTSEKICTRCRILTTNFILGGIIAVVSIGLVLYSIRGKRLSTALDFEDNLPSTNSSSNKTASTSPSTALTAELESFLSTIRNTPTTFTTAPPTTKLRTTITSMWLLVSNDHYCPISHFNGNGMRQLDCQNLCQQEFGCVGISYSHSNGGCYTCKDSFLSTAENGYGFYRNPVVCPNDFFCSNGGTCVDGSCSCPSGVLGDTCEIGNTLNMPIRLIYHHNLIICHF